LDELSLTYAFTTAECLLGSSVEIRAKLGESSNLTVLSEEEFERASHLLHGLELGSRADTRHGETDIDGRSNSLVEELRLQEDLAVGNRDDVRRNVGRHVTTLSLNNRESGHRATTVSLLVHFGCTLKETRVKVEDISRVGLTAWGTTEEQRHLAVGDSLLREIVIDDERVLSTVTEEFSHRSA
jgi:hypothetical protein